MSIKIENKKVLIRCDFNVPIKDNVITDETRILESIETINYFSKKNAVILLSHLGRIKTLEDKKNNSLEIIVPILEKYLNKKIIFIKTLGEKEIQRRLSNIKNGEIFLLENTRFYDLDNEKESRCDLNLAKFWASLADVFINDAFALIHRTHASNYGISKFIPSYKGFLVEKEINNLDKVIHPKRLFGVVMGGKKIDDKIGVIDRMLEKCDYLFLGGGIANTFLKALGYEIGLSIYSENYLDYAFKTYEKYKSKIYLPFDFITERGVVLINNLKKDDIILDVGPSSSNFYKFKIKNIKTVFFNGPLGKYEDERGKSASLDILSAMEKVEFSILGGGDILSLAKNNGYKDKMYYTSTGGGATLEYIVNQNLPTLKELENEKK